MAFDLHEVQEFVQEIVDKIKESPVRQVKLCYKLHINPSTLDKILAFDFTDLSFKMMRGFIMEVIFDVLLDDVIDEAKDPILLDLLKKFYSGDRSVLPQIKVIMKRDRRRNFGELLVRYGKVLAREVSELEKITD